MTLPGGKPAGLSQNALGLVQGKAYVGRVILAGDASAAPVEVSLIWGEGPNDRETVKIDALTAEYAKYPVKFKAGAASENGRFEIVSKGTGKLWVATASLMPADNIKGWRKDTVEMLKKLNSPVYRWPGGNFVSGYNWRDGIGETDRRPTRKNPAWTGLEYNDVGIHEFMDLCDILGTEPYIAVNTGLGTVEETAQEVEYVNGSVDTPLGKLRAENGHPEPYKCKWWGVGNEMFGNWQLGHMPQKDYIIKHNKVADAMWAMDKSITLIGWGTPVTVGPRTCSPAVRTRWTSSANTFISNRSATCPRM
jgi:alpha-N-arabinofuranosidase